jgi:hypothetical protein
MSTTPSALVLADVWPVISFLARQSITWEVQLASNRAAIGMAASVISLMEGAMRDMFWNKLRFMAASTLAGGVLAGTAALAY